MCSSDGGNCTDGGVFVGAGLDGAGFVVITVGSDGFLL